MTNLLADIQIRPQGFTGLGSSTLAQPTGDGVSTLANIISVSLGIITIIGIIWFVFIFATGAIAIMGSGADKNAYESAKRRISTGLLGIVVLLVAVFAIDLIGYFMGFGTGGILNIEGLFSTLQL